MSDLGRNELLVKLATTTARGGYRIAYGLLRDREEARDMVQEALARACENVEGLRNPQSVESWFYRVVANLCHDSLGRRRRFVDELPADLPAPTPQADERLARAHESTRVTEAVAALPAMQRATVALRYGEERPLEEVARALGVALGTAKSHLHRAQEKLRAVLQGATSAIVCEPLPSLP